MMNIDISSLLLLKSRLRESESYACIMYTSTYKFRPGVRVVLSIEVSWETRMYTTLCKRGRR